MVPTHVLDIVRTEVILSGRDTRYRVEAYLFILNVIHFLHTKAGDRRHYTGQQISTACVDFSVRQFGLLAQAVFTFWGIHNSSDIGYIVYNLIDIKLLKKQPSDSIADFFNVLDFKEYYAHQDHFTIDRGFIKSIKGA